MANTILTPTAVTREALRILHQKLNFIGSITRDYDSSYAKTGAKIGDTLKIRLPNEYAVSDGATLVTQDTTETSVQLQVNRQKHVGLNFTDVDLTLSIDDFSDRILEPAMARLASAMEADAMTMFLDVYQSVWNGGSATTFAKILQGRKLLQDALAPTNARTANLNTQDNVDLVDALKGLFNDTKEVSKQYREGYMGRTAGFDFMENTLWPGFTRGAGNTAYTTDTRTSALATDGTSYSSITVASGSGALKKGDVFTIANCYRVHPETKASTGILQQFVCTADQTSGTTTIAFSPAIILGGAKQTVVFSANSATAAISFAGTASTAVGTSLLYQKEAFAFATADLIMPKGVHFGARENYDGISMRIVSAYDINNDKFPYRIDVLYGYKTLRPQLAARLHSN